MRAQVDLPLLSHPRFSKPEGPINAVVPLPHFLLSFTVRIVAASGHMTSPVLEHTSRSGVPPPSFCSRRNPRSNGA